MLFEEPHHRQYLYVIISIFLAFYILYWVIQKLFPSIDLNAKEEPVRSAEYHKWRSIYLGQPTKCFDCESSLPDSMKHLGGPSKCYDCETQFVAGGKEGDWGQPTKVFDAEQQMAQGSSYPRFGNVQNFRG